MRKIINLLFIVVFISCSIKTVEKKTEEMLIDCPTGNLKTLLDSFVIEVDVTDKINEVYIDKISIWEYDIIIYSGYESLTESAKPLFYTLVNEEKFYIFSGLEHYFCKNNNQTKNNDGPKKEGPPNGDYWVINDKNDRLIIIKGDWAMPFYSLPTKMYKEIEFTDPSKDSIMN